MTMMDFMWIGNMFIAFIGAKEAFDAAQRGWKGFYAFMLFVYTTNFILGAGGLLYLIFK